MSERPEVSFVFNPDGYSCMIFPKNGADFSLEELYNWVDCSCVERVVINDEFELWIDEEGKMADKPINMKASYLARFVLQPGDVIVGNALLCKKGMVK